MIARYPFHVALLSRMHVTCDTTIPTMAVTEAGGKVLLLHNPGFVLSITVAELVGVLQHEVHHVLFGHLSMKPEDYPNKAALTIAQEVTVNEYITEPLPPTPVLLAQYPILPPRESTARRYKRLERVIPPTTVVVTLDDHGAWGAGDKAGNPGSAARQAVEDAVVSVDPAQIPQELREHLEELLGPGTGSTPGRTQEAFTRRGQAQLDWRRLLQRYVGQVLEVRPVYNRPPRRFPHLVGIMPGRGRQASKPRILAAIDTSGSMSTDMLGMIDSELSKLAKHHEVLVVECDAQIQRTYPYRPVGCDARVAFGRGGTDFRPVLSKDFLARHKPDLVLYFTDGYGPAPRKAPTVPVIWCLLPGGTQPTKWGRQIRLVAHNARFGRF
jgi:predicted metal-dependent peptidase